VSDDAEKRFDPTPARLRRARVEGDVPRAAELGAGLALLGGGATLCGLLPVAIAALRAAVVAAAAGRSAPGAYLTLGACACAPAVASALCGAGVSIALCGGPHATAIAFKAERLSPVAGLKRMCSRESLLHAGRASFALVCSSAVACASGWGVVAAGLHGGAPAALAAATWDAAARTVASACVVGCAFGAIELLAARRAWLRRLRMSFADYKRDLKEQDGDPQVRGRRRALHRSLSRGDVRRVREAAFVVTNPTHLAIALAYAPPAEPVPRVLVCAADELAARVRALARDAAVPLVENVALARALFARARVGETIPHDLYVAVAEVVAALSRAGAPT
jgi:flagellar biosynthesis protein FlhB